MLPLLLTAFLCCCRLSSSADPASVTQILAPGQVAPVSSLKAIDNVEHCFPVAENWNLVFFWSLFCHSCIEEMPEIQARLAEYEASDLKVYFVSLDTARMQKALINFCRLRGFDRPVLMERIASDSYEVADRWGVVMTPSTFVVNPEGKIVWSHQGPLDIAGLFAELDAMRAALASSPSQIEDQ